MAEPVDEALAAVAWATPASARAPPKASAVAMRAGRFIRTLNMMWVDPLRGLVVRGHGDLRQWTQLQSLPCFTHRSRVRDGYCGWVKTAFDVRGADMDVQRHASDGPGPNRRETERQVTGGFWEGQCSCTAPDVIYIDSLPSPLEKDPALRESSLTSLEESARERRSDSIFVGAQRHRLSVNRQFGDSIRVHKVIFTGIDDARMHARPTRGTRGVRAGQADEGEMKARAVPE